MNTDDHNNEDVGKAKAKSEADSDGKCEGGKSKADGEWEANSDGECKGGEESKGRGGGARGQEQGLGGKSKG
ncbi:hypothetical protein CVT25_004543 [Psilocybe cyanescens]|uniref:Uncharacterized protein n=1 Tax=Psilocybe cyanescens TaxID=93625 RepID=A0A409WBR3_PSICY|nr:hypothetical protein CVT25_004543 [Psilocybe cyanescens]